jgi:hypothetical protein
MPWDLLPGEKLWREDCAHTTEIINAILCSRFDQRLPGQSAHPMFISVQLTVQQHPLHYTASAMGVRPTFVLVIDAIFWPLLDPVITAEYRLACDFASFRLVTLTTGLQSSSRVKEPLLSTSNSEKYPMMSLISSGDAAPVRTMQRMINSATENKFEITSNNMHSETRKCPCLTTQPTHLCR